MSCAWVQFSEKPWSTKIYNRLCCSMDIWCYGWAEHNYYSCRWTSGSFLNTICSFLAFNLDFYLLQRYCRKVALFYVNGATPSFRSIRVNRQLSKEFVTRSSKVMATRWQICYCVSGGIDKFSEDIDNFSTQHIFVRGMVKTLWFFARGHWGINYPLEQIAPLSKKGNFFI